MGVDVSTTSNSDSFGGAKLGWECWDENDEGTGEEIVSSGSYSSGETPSLVFTNNGAKVSIKGSFKANTSGWSNLNFVLTLNRTVGGATSPAKYALSKVFYWPAPKT